MLRKLTAENFKSIGSPVEIELSPLTIVTGSNSSGKSTLLQCLLLLLQTLRHSSPDRQLVLNGPLAQLGEFDDILHSGARSRQVTIGLTVAPPASTDDSPQALMRKARVPAHVVSSWAFGDRNVGGDTALSLGKTFPTIDSLQITGYFDMGDHYEPAESTIRRHPWATDRRRRKEGYGLGLSAENQRSLAWSVKLSPGLTDSDVRGVVFDHCLPAEFTCRFDVRQEMARHLLRTLSVQRSQGNASAPTDWQYFGDLWTLIVEHLFVPLELSTEALGEEPTIAEVRGWLQSQTPANRRRVIQKLDSASETVLRLYRDQSEKVPWLFGNDLPDPLERSVSAVRESILNLRYLGPLRVQPAPIYPVATTLGAEDVGPSGEWTASVLDTYRSKSISFIPPSEIPFASPDAARRVEPLIEAVRIWMKYLGVADQVETVDRGSLGHEMTVSGRESRRKLPLTHVGVGVSQCLPVVVSLLLAPEGSLTLLEQPELHLHPAVQSRLGDFLVAMSASGRQCFVETHSEYLINRLRLRIAEAEGSELQEHVTLLFAEHADGESTFRQVEVNKYGAIVDWPAGFFDDTQDDIERLLSASRRKRSVRVRNS